MFVSTRGASPSRSFSEAILDGLAPDGGLYVPEGWPEFADAELAGWTDLGLPEFASRLLAPFMAGDVLQDRLTELCRDAFNFPVVRADLEPGTEVLELFHGPTAAFKDFGARFLSACLSALRDVDARTPRLRVLVATSGDTGAAVAAACHGRAGLDVGVLFPRGGVSPRQEAQLTCWTDNVRSFSVDGTFDDCQRMTKELFRRGGWPAEGTLTSANSINVGRLLPQVVYAAWAAIGYRARTGASPSFVVPSGNLGNVVGVFWARRLGFPIDRIVIATNANRPVPDWFETGEWSPRPSIRTLANAMDVGAPSNMERLLHLHDDHERLRREVAAVSVDDATIRRVIQQTASRSGVVACPHTATGLHVRAGLSGEHWIVYATAHPAKFHETVEPLVGRSIPVPHSLEDLLSRPRAVTQVGASADALVAAWDKVKE